MSRIYFVRHGQTDWNLAKRIQGSHDTELNKTGLQQAKDLSLTILKEGYTFDTIYSSFQKRATQTAEVLSQETGVELKVVDGLEEIKLGQWEGLTWTQVRENFSREYASWIANIRYALPPQGESYQQMLLRVYDCTNRIYLEKPNQDILIVTHSAVIMCLQCLLNDTPFLEMRKYMTENASVLCINTTELFSESLVKRLKKIEATRAVF